MPYNVVLFDGDGVTIKEGRLFSEVLLESHGISMEAMQPFFKGPFQRCVVGEADLKEELAKVIGGWGWSGTVDALMHYWFSTGDNLNEEIVSLIKNLRATGVPCYLVSNNEHYRGAYLWNRLRHLFDGAFISGDVGFKKNQEAFFAHVVQKVHVTDRASILLIDDDQENVETAKSFGIDAVHYRQFSDLDGIISL
ncbi:MAG: HAD-IA family hydrolase [bacterium]|nr:HAD-IA family hydrolase [bacterium]